MATDARCGCSHYTSPRLLPHDKSCGIPLPPDRAAGDQNGSLVSPHLSATTSSAVMSNLPPPANHVAATPQDTPPEILPPPPRSVPAKPSDGEVKPGTAAQRALSLSKHGVGHALSDTPATTAPSSPRIPPLRQNSGTSLPRVRPTTLDIPGLTRSKVSPDGKIAQRDIGAKLVIIMVGLPARGKSYVTKKLARYLNWLQHDTRIFNVGERRRVAAGGPGRISQSNGQRRQSSMFKRANSLSTSVTHGILENSRESQSHAAAANILINGEASVNSDGTLPTINISEDSNGLEMPLRRKESSAVDDQLGSSLGKMPTPGELPRTESMDQSAAFFDPKNVKAAQIREQVAMQTLDELLEYILEQGGSVGILDATNSTRERRALIMKRIRDRAGPELGVLFLESQCLDPDILEANMRLKLSGPDYKDQDPVKSLEDFKKRVAIYEKNYVPLGDFEEKHDIQYVQMIDVGRKIVSHQIRGFLAAQTVYYLLNFNLSARQIWITRHGQSMDNVAGKIGGDSDLSANGHKYAKALTRFIAHARKEWAIKQRDKALSSHFPPAPGDATPPNPEYRSVLDGDPYEKNFCVWTSMLKRGIQTTQYFDEEEFDVKQMRMLDEINAGVMEGLTYEEIKERYAAEYELRRRDKLHYRYPGAGGESYLDIINRLRAVIVEIERMTDHLLLICHRSVARVLLSYFKGLKREEVADLDVPLGMLYMLEPKPYGVEFKAYEYNPEKDWFDHLPNFELQPSRSQWN